MRKAAGFFLLCCVLAAAVFSSALSETLGFGFVNRPDVALRRGVGGKVIVRLPENACVWIRDSKADSQGVLWYEVNAGIHADNANVDYTGWMKSEFVDAGDVLWHDLVSVKVSRNGMIALRADGTAESAGSLPAPSPADWTAARTWSESLRNIRQVGFCEHGLVRYALEENGTFHACGAPAGILGTSPLRLVGGDRFIYGITEDCRLLMGESEVRCGWAWPHAPSPEELSHVIGMEDNGCRVLLLTDSGTVFASEDESGDTSPDWAAWTGIVSLDASACVFDGGGGYRAAYAAVREDGTALAAPEALAASVGSWTRLVQIAVSDRWVLGLRDDGTVLSAGFAGVTPPDVSGWKEIVGIGTGYGFCVGIRRDGTAVFAGDYLFMREGHTRK